MSSTSIGNGYSPYHNYYNNHLQNYDNCFNGKATGGYGGVQNYDNAYSNYYNLSPAAGDHYPYGAHHHYLPHGPLAPAPLTYGAQSHCLDADRNGFGKAYANAAFSTGSLPSVAGGVPEKNSQKPPFNGYNNYQQHQYQPRKFCFIFLCNKNFLNDNFKKNFLVFKSLFL